MPVKNLLIARKDNSVSWMDGDGKVWGFLWRGWSERIPQHRGPEAGHAVGVGTVETEVTEV